MRTKPTTMRSHGARFGGFTLIEMLLVISIIVVLSSLALVVLRGAQEDARAARTQSIINRTREILLSKFESYETRPLPFSIAQVAPGANLSQQQFLRRRVMMEWVRAEMPSYYEDLESFPSQESRIANPVPTPPKPGVMASADPRYWPNSISPNDWIDRFVLQMQFRAPVALAANRRLLLMTAGSPEPWNANGGDNAPNVARNDPAVQNNPAVFRQSLIEGAECLYAILHNTWYNDQRGTHFLNPSEIGDLDNDGRPEVLDAWGEPMYFLIYRKLDIDINGDGVIDNLDRDVNGDGTVDFRDTFLNPNYPIELKDYVIDLRSTRSGQF